VPPNCLGWWSLGHQMRGGSVTRSARGDRVGSGWSVGWVVGSGWLVGR
jgi:hypothetical protein